MDRAARVRVPARRALAAEEGQERQAVVARIALRERSRRVAERPLEPLVEVAAVGERAALDDAARVREIEEEARLRLRPLALVEDAERARGADHERGALARHAAGARVGAGGVGPERHVGDPWQALLLDAEDVEQLGVPVPASRGRAGRSWTPFRGSSRLPRAGSRRRRRSTPSGGRSRAPSPRAMRAWPARRTGGGRRPSARGRPPGRASARASPPRRCCGCRASRGSA